MVHVVWLVVLSATVGAVREIDFKNCKSPTGFVSCKVKAVEIDGCLEPTSWVDRDQSIIEYREEDRKRPCRIDSGSTLNFTISFEPGFSADYLKSQFSLPFLDECWRVTEPQCPLTDPPEDGCDRTKCPLQSDRQQVFETTLQVSRTIAPRPYNARKITQLRWKLWNNKQKKGDSCCFNIPVQY